ncbi:hypothetical protein E2C06_30875 [Dankookia rubra]|uniref:Glyoxalase n=1 Tax=Dankookia rubra TaxID=1442381 RepID=A0A4R5Q7R9_9PROT|nr:hypothetical protein [Dankookia rubra]TDH58766.1 hypothetical protein E2C06_30875 [Dankookia rubra]
MAFKILEFHHSALGINGSEPGLAADRAFYRDVLGLPGDSKRQTLPGIPGLWINVGEIGQLRLVGGTQFQRLAKKGPDSRARLDALTIV